MERMNPGALPNILPELREDLRLAEGATLSDGSPSWTIQDPVSNVFYRIGWLEFELLARWHLGSPVQVLAATRTETPLAPTEEELGDLIAFLHQHQLLVIRTADHTASLLALARRQKLGAMKWLLHHYLFFRLPLWHPERWLTATLPAVRWLYHRSTAWVLAGLCLTGLVLTYRQIDVFSATFVDTLTPGGLLAYLAALAFTKSLHELGHAYTATRYGVRVAHMGVAFVVLWPMLYTDTGESWRLKDSRQRLAIASAGIITEFAIAGLATLAWSLAPPGDLRQAFFFLATTAWLISLALNASPFMRFDGYFILSDWLDMPNLHERAFEQARCWLRRVLLGWQDEPSEVFTPARRRMLIGFALGVWIYRLVVFFGIALLVYHYFFKLLGLFLFAVEIGWFIIRPIAQEVTVWRQRRHEIPLGRQRRLATVGAGALVFLLLPLDGSVSAPAWAHAGQSQVIYSPFAARIEAIDAHAGAVDAAQTLFRLESPDAALKTRVAAERKEGLERQLAGLMAVPEGEGKRASMTEQEALRAAEMLAGSAESARLHLKAPFAGVLSDLDPEIRPGVWVSPRQPLGVLWSPDTWVLEAFVGQEDLARIQPGRTVRYYPEVSPLRMQRGEVIEVESFRVNRLPNPLLSAALGGPIATLHQDTQSLTPVQSLYRIRVRLFEKPDTLTMQRGRVVIDARLESWGLALINSFLAVLVREASF